MSGRQIVLGAVDREWADPGGPAPPSLSHFQMFRSPAGSRVRVGIENMKQKNSSTPVTIEVRRGRRERRTTGPTDAVDPETLSSATRKGHLRTATGMGPGSASDGTTGLPVMVQGHRPGLAMHPIRTRGCVARPGRVPVRGRAARRWTGGHRPDRPGIPYGWSSPPR